MTALHTVFIGAARQLQTASVSWHRDGSDLGLGRVRRVRRRDAGGGPVRAAPPGPRGIPAGSGPLERRLDRDRPGLRGLLWAWRGGGTAQAYLAGYLIEKSLSLDNVFVFAVVFSAFAIPLRYQHRVLMLGILGALVMRAAFILAGAALLDSFHLVSYLFGAVLLFAAVKLARGRDHVDPRRNRALRALGRILPATDELRGQRFLVRDRGRVLATPLLLALIAVETTDVIFAVDSIPAILAVTTDTFVVYTSNVFALLGMRALYFLLAGAAGQFRYLQPGLAVILAGIAAKMLTADLYEVPVWVSPAFIAVVLAVVAVLSLRDSRSQSPDRRKRGPGVTARKPVALRGRP
jgi:tellurite resistance protein TerC